MSTHTRRASLALAVLTCSTLMVGCGVDPPGAPSESPAVGEAAAPAEPAGAPLVERAELEAPKSNGQLARCNVETLAEQSLEGKHPTLKAGRAVVVRGWYALPKPAGTGAVKQEAPTDSSAAPAGTPPAHAVASSGSMLVIASENGARHWTVTLPEMRLRKDVAEALGDPSLGNSGFDIALDLSALAPGFYGVHLSDGAHTPASVCGIGRGFVIQ